MTTSCIHPGCDKPREVSSRSRWCSGHRQRRKDGRDVDAPWQIHRRGLSAYELVMSTVERRGECLIFTGFVASNGYGRVETKSGGVQMAHRVVAARHMGPSQLLVLHSCDIPTCVEPSHLRYGTHADNARDKAERERAPRGEANHKTRLTEADVREIRADPRPSAAVAADYGCAGRTVRNIRTRRTWGWLD